MIRAALRSEVWAAYREEKPEVRFRLVVLRVNLLQSIAANAGFVKLSFATSPDGLDLRFGEPWAHCTAVEINRTVYDEDASAKKRIKEWAMNVATSLTSQEVIVEFQKPTEHDPYRPRQGVQERCSQDDC